MLIFNCLFITKRVLTYNLATYIFKICTNQQYQQKQHTMTESYKQ